MLKKSYTWQLINSFLFAGSVILFSCTQQTKTNERESAADFPSTNNDAANIPTSPDNSPTEPGRKINNIFQDKNGNYWFATNGEGVYRYDNKSLIRFTEKDGLSSDYAGTIQEDKSGLIWFSTAFGICSYNGKTFLSHTNIKSEHRRSTVNEWKTEPGDLWFGVKDGAYRYDGKSFTYLQLINARDPKNSKPIKPFLDPLSPWSVYCTLKDKKGNVWLGTQTMGVCRFDGNSFTWLNEKGLGGPAVRSIFEDRNGILWFGNNGSGLFRYDGKTLTNFTEENGLGNPDFVKNNKQGPGTLARVWTINEDDNGNIWIGTADAGAWRYDGKTLTNFTMVHGLTSNHINTIYKDRKGELWFGTEGAGVCRFNGISFTRFAINHP
jgi:ligand-binding sensor domain-containing protein